MRKQFAYRPYLVTENPIYQKWAISKDGHHIGWANSETEARSIIDLLTS